MCLSFIYVHKNDNFSRFLEMAFSLSLACRNGKSPDLGKGLFCPQLELTFSGRSRGNFSLDHPSYHPRGNSWEQWAPGYSGNCSRTRPVSKKARENESGCERDSGCLLHYLVKHLSFLQFRKFNVAKRVVSPLHL